MYGGGRGTTVFISVRTSIKRKYESIPKKESRVVLILGIVLFFTSLMLIPSVILAFRAGDSIWPFVIPLALGLAASVYMCLKFKLPNDMRPADGLMMMFSVWILLFAFGTLPFLIDGMTLIDAIFESVSGFSTTGATILRDVESASAGILFWRVTTNWIGGIIIVMMFMFIIPMVVTGGRGLLKNEMSGSGGGNLSMKLGSAAKQFIVMYIILTAIFAGVLLLLGVSIVDSVTIAMSSISIGGFLNTNDSMASYSIFVKLSVALFMIISASNFYLHYRALFKGDLRGYAKNEEFKVMVVWFFFVFMMIAVQCLVSGAWGDLEGSAGDKLVNIIFTVVSVGTTSGFSAVDVNYEQRWPFIDLSLFMVLMFIGGSAGSTSGGVKISRIIIAIKALFNEIRQEVHPNAIYSVRFNGGGVSGDVVHSAMVVITAFVVAVGIGAALFNMIFSLDDAVFMAVAMVTNTGIGSGAYFSNFADFPVWTKLVSCALMFLGRMEILAILVIFTPGFWLEFLGRGGINDIKSKITSVGKIRVAKRKKAEAEEIGLPVAEAPSEEPPVQEAPAEE